MCLINLNGRLGVRRRATAGCIMGRIITQSSACPVPVPVERLELEPAEGQVWRRIFKSDRSRTAWRTCIRKRKKEYQFDEMLNVWMALLLALCFCMEAECFQPSAVYPGTTSHRSCTQIQHVRRPLHVILSLAMSDSSKRPVENQQQALSEQDIADGAKKFWNWKNGWRIHYSSTEGKSDATPLLLLSGFGVGGFHYDRNVPELAMDGARRVYTMDVLGQGLSWPTADPAPGGGMDRQGFEWGFGGEACSETKGAELTYSCRMWRDQTIDFIDQVVGEPVYVAGNSLGGYLSMMVASERPELIKGMFLINPTPWWGVGPQRLLPWEGGYPVPSWVRPLTTTWWDTIRNPNTIRTLLGQVYADDQRVGKDLVDQIIVPTNKPAAASAFASILCSPGSELSFDEMLSKVSATTIPVALCYGKEDPWIVPIWGQRAKRILTKAPYLELSPAGHCPHHEVPEVVNLLITSWMADLEGRESDEALMRLLREGGEGSDVVVVDSAVDGCSKPVSITPHGAEPRTVMEHLDTLWWRATSSSWRS